MVKYFLGFFWLAAFFAFEEDAHRKESQRLSYQSGIKR